MDCRPATTDADSPPQGRPRENGPAPGRHGIDPAPGRRGITVAVPAAETVRLYAADWSAFATWCRAAARPALPASPETVAAYLATWVATHRPGALARHLAAIGDRHRRHGLASPADDPGIRAQLREARFRPSTAARPAPPSAIQLQAMAERCRDDLAGLRDRALLLLAAAPGLGSSGAAQAVMADMKKGWSAAALIRLDVEHVRVSEPGLILTIVPGGGQSEPSQMVVSRSATGVVCPVQAMEVWLRDSDTRYGPVFRKVDRWGNVEHTRLGAESVGRIINRRSAAARPRRAARDRP